jgi:outer membrane protein assembly factor BamB
MLMRYLPFLLLSGLALVLMTGGADAKEPEWNYTADASINSVAISADGEYIVAGSDDSKVYFFDKDNNTPLWSYTAGDGVFSVAISSDGETIVAGSIDNNVYLFSKDGTLLWSYGTGNRVWSVAIAENGETIVAGSWDNKVYLFDKDSSTPLWSYTTGNWVLSVDISADGEMIAVGSDKVYLFGRNSSTPRWSYSTGDTVRAVALSEDFFGQQRYHLAAGDWNGKVYLFHNNNSVPLWNHTTGDSIYSVAITDDSGYVAVGSKDYSVYLLDGDGTSLWSYATGGTVLSLDFSVDGEELAVGSDKVYLFDKDSGTPLWGYTTGNSVKSVGISADGEDIISGSGDKEIYLFDKDVPPTAQIDSIEPTTIRFDEEVTFTGSGSGVGVSIVAYEWTSSLDGLLGNEAELSVTGFSSGEHTISFRVQDENGEWSGWDTALLTATPNLLPVATIDSITPSSARFKNEVVTFDGSGSDDDGTITGWEWNSSLDGILSTEEDPSESGFTPGTHTISFRVQDNDGGWSDWDTATLIIHPNTLPVAMIDSISPSPVEEGITVSFRGSGTDDDGTIMGYEWNSSLDGVLSNEKDFNGTGFSAGTHTISFRVQDNNGGWSNWDSSTLVVILNTPPTGAIGSISPSPVEEGTITSFTGSGSDSEGAIVAYRWSSSLDGELSSEKDFSSNTLSLGTHTVTFQVQDNVGAWSVEDSRTLVVGIAPVAKAGDDIEVEPKTEVQFIGLGNDDGTIVNYEWDFDGDGNYDWSSERHGITTTIYYQIGSYTAVLRLTDDEGFTSTDSRTITVIRPEAEETESGLPAPSIIISMAAMAFIALRRRY